MKKFLIVTTCCAALAAPAMAVVQCIKMDTSACVPDSGDTRGSSDWAIACDDTYVSGVSACSASWKAGVVWTTGSNVYCYCRVVSPFLTPWIMTHQFSSEVNCIESCSTECAYSNSIEVYLNAN